MMVAMITTGRPVICEEFLYRNDQARGVFPADKPLPKCMNIATYVVEGKCYCKRHAMGVVFDLVMKKAGP